MGAGLGAAGGLRDGIDGHGTRGGNAAFAIGHPEKVIDFAYRAVHEMAVKRRRSSPRSTVALHGSRTGLVAPQAGGRG